VAILLSPHQGSDRTVQGPDLPTQRCAPSAVAAIPVKAGQCFVAEAVAPEWLV
jgi:hypothetical protein